jgi:hypothetical protein
MAGRPTKVTPDVLAKWEQAFALGCTDTEACLYADVSVDVLYDYQRKNLEFAKRKERLKENPMLKARTTVVGALGEVEHAKWYLERKKKDEFAQKQQIENSGEITIVIDEKDKNA